MSVCGFFQFLMEPFALCTASITLSVGVPLTVACCFFTVSLCLTAFTAFCNSKFGSNCSFLIMLHL